MLDFLDRRRKRKLYQQWISTSGLPQEEIPAELQEPETNAEEIGTVNREPQNTRYIGGQYLPMKLRYILYVAAIIIVFVVIISVLATVLVMRSC